jgi:hypothetical protein
MYLQITTNVVIIFLLGSSVLASECKNEPLGLSVYFFSEGDQWSVTWMNDGKHKKKANYYNARKEPIRTNVHESSGNWRAEKLPLGLLSSKEMFNVPFEVSQNKELLIAAIYEDSHISYPSQRFAIVDLRKQEIVRIIEAEYQVRSLAWSPDSKYFAVLYERDVTKQVFKGPLDWFAELLGHGISYSTFYLTIYHADGTAVCTEEVAKKKPRAMSFIDWGNRFDELKKNNADSEWVRYVKNNCPVISDRLGSHAFDARRKAEPVNVYTDWLAFADKDADAYEREFTKRVTSRIYESVYVNKNLQTKEQAVKEAVNICIESWLAFDPTGEKHAAEYKGKQ